VTVLLTTGTDKVIMHTTLPCPYPPGVSEQPLSLVFDVVSDHGVEYVHNNFGIEPTVISTRR